ncbi:hypothetical protein HaLaN_07610 [Haematococcus lacustris]|uniref:Uncharacterized protein n=1 Tax=Haematococcus lacustris TaxID=44745 RepID=A0A699YWS7_HAELA|nr:hypothetical protein HaLaN_07610 [Haematococcus lacustris]
MQAYQVKRELPLKPASTKLQADGPFVGVPAGPSPLLVNLLWDLPAVAAEPSGTTSHKADYQQRSAVAVVKAKGPGSSLATIQGPFEGVSLYKESFG